MPRQADPTLPSRIAEAAYALWRKDGDPPGPLLPDLQKTQDEARKKQVGIWKTNPGYMEAKAKEAPEKK